MKVRYVSPVVDYAGVRKSKAVPDQSLSIQEIVKRYVRGVPVDVVQRPAVYVEQSEFDLEQMSRMDFGEKAEYSAIMQERADKMRNAWQDAERSAALARSKAAQEASAKQAPASAEGANA